MALMFMMVHLWFTLILFQYVFFPGHGILHDQLSLLHSQLLTYWLVVEPPQSEKHAQVKQPTICQ